MEAGNDSGVLSAVDSMMATFSGSKYLSEVVSREIAARYYRRGLQLEGTDSDAAKKCFQQAAVIWDKAIKQLPGSGATAEGCCLSGDIYVRLGDYQNAVRCYEKVVNDYPMYRRTWHALATAANTYDRMKQKGLVSAEEADPKIRGAYLQLLEVYPECRAAKAARTWLNNHPL
jgi:tetratricopeptide (TPR) repeat protein